MVKRISHMIQVEGVLVAGESALASVNSMES